MLYQQITTCSIIITISSYDGKKSTLVPNILICLNYSMCYIDGKEKQNELVLDKSQDIRCRKFVLEKQEIGRYEVVYKSKKKEDEGAVIIIEDSQSAQPVQ